MCFLFPLPVIFPSVTALSSFLSCTEHLASPSVGTLVTWSFYLPTLQLPHSCTRPSLSVSPLSTGQAFKSNSSATSSQSLPCFPLQCVSASQSLVSAWLFVSLAVALHFPCLPECLSVFESFYLQSPAEYLQTQCEAQETFALMLGSRGMWPPVT